MNNIMINKRLFRIAGIIPLFAALAGCGLKGPLYFPESKPAVKPTSVAASPVRSDAKMNNDESGAGSSSTTVTQHTGAQVAQ